MSVLPKAIFRFSAIPVKISMAHFTELEQIFQKFTWNHKRSQIATAILGKKNKVGDFMPLDIKLIYKAIVSKKYGIGIKADIMVNRTENPEKSPPFSGQLVFHKGCKNIQWGKDNLLNK